MYLHTSCTCMYVCVHTFKDSLVCLNNFSLLFLMYENGHSEDSPSISGGEGVYVVTYGYMSGVTGVTSLVFTLTDMYM